ELRTLADAEMRGGRDRDQVRLELANGVHVAPREGLERDPALARRRNVLPLVVADRACCRRLVARRILRSACGADECWHDTPDSNPAGKQRAYWSITE